MNIAFRHLFTIGFDHPYYAGRCRDFRFVVPRTTAALLREARLLTREEDGTLQVYYEADENGARLVDFTGRTLLFGLRLANAQFENFTVPPVADPTLSPLFRNTAAPNAFGPAVGAQVVCGTYVHAPKQANRPVTLSLSDENGNVLAIGTATLPEDAPAFDLHVLPEGWWTITEDYGAGAVNPRTLLLDAGLATEGIWGLAAVKVANAFYNTPPTIKVPFAAPSEPLDYYVVATNYLAGDFNLLEIKDGGFIEQSRPEVQFAQVPPGADDLAAKQVGQPGDKVALFRSLTPVARRERGLRHIRLLYAGSPLIENLPQPSAQKARAQLVIHVSKP